MWENIKSHLEDETLFFSVLTILVAATSFGLGRISIIPIAGNTQTAGIVLTHTATSSGIAAETIMVQRYVGSKNSDKYHLPYCSGAQRIAEDNKVWFQTEEEAEKAGYTPAANCEGI